MAEKKTTIDVSPSLEGGSTLDDLPAESHYHDIDVFGREEDHEVSSPIQARGCRAYYFETSKQYCLIELEPLHASID